MEFFFFLFVGVPLIFFIWLFSLPKPPGHQERKDALFYQECVKNGIKKCETEEEIQRAALIAKRLNITCENIRDCYYKSKDALKKAKEIENEEEVKKEVEKRSRQEQEQYRRLERYASFSGQEKRIAMLIDEKRQYEEKARDLWNQQRLLVKGVERSPTDEHWATMGGLASAIAGPAAGMAVASDLQAKEARENAGIEAYNQAMRMAIAPAALKIGGKESEMWSKAEQVEEKIEQAKLKLVSDETKEECFARLTISDIKTSVSIGGAGKVKAHVSLSPVSIFGKVPAVIDGTLYADFYDQDTLIGTGLVVFPAMGIRSEGTIEGMAPLWGEPWRKYQVKFRLKNLWLMEQ